MHTSKAKEVSNIVKNYELSNKRDCVKKKNETRLGTKEVFTMMDGNEQKTNDDEKRRKSIGI